jgi:6-phosphogluconolactonase
MASIVDRQDPPRRAGAAGLSRRGFVAAGVAGMAAAGLDANSGAAVADGQLVWFGTYTGGPSGSEGIYVSRFDAATGTLSPPVLAGRAKNPSFLALHPRLPVLYAVSEVSDADGRPTGGVLAFRVNAADGTLTPINHQPSGGKGPCHVSVDPTGRVVLAANYGGGSVIALGVADDGGLRPVTAADGGPGGFIQHEGKSVNPQRQEGPHGHSINPTADGRFAIACDLGVDKVFVHAVDAGRATLAAHGHAVVKAGAGPRHFAFHPDGRHGYCVNELDLTVTAFDFDPAAGALVPVQSLSTLPADVGDTKGFSTAEIVAHPGGRFVYASNRGHDTIAMYAVDGGTGRLSFLGVEPIRGQVPRNFVLDPSGRFLLAAGQKSDTVTVFAIDPKIGRLSFTGQTLPVPAPVCIRFLPARSASAPASSAPAFPSSPASPSSTPPAP